MPSPRILILRAPGTNCDHETAFAFEKAGGQPELIHINRLLDEPKLSADYQVMCLPGGFSYGDDVAAGRIFANKIRHRLRDTIAEFKAAEKLILGICNGFQILIKAGVLLDDNQADGDAATLTWNDSRRFEDRWVSLRVPDAGKCVFLQGVSQLYLPIAHAEGKFVTRSRQVFEDLKAAGQLVLRYADQQGLTDDDILPFPHNPNGSTGNVAGLCDETGRVFGLMPHPERHIEPTHHPRWTRGEGKPNGDGLVVFENAVQYFA